MGRETKWEFITLYTYRLSRRVSDVLSVARMRHREERKVMNGRAELRGRFVLSGGRARQNHAGWGGVTMWQVLGPSRCSIMTPGYLYFLKA